MNNLKSYLYLTNINKNTLSVLNPYSWKDLISVNRSELLIFSSRITFMILIFLKIRIYITTFNSDILIWKRNVVKGFNFVQNMFWRENELNICNAQVKLQEMFYSIYHIPFSYEFMHQKGNWFRIYITSSCPIVSSGCLI